MSREAEILARVIENRDFARSLLFDDCTDDWNLAGELGEYLTRIHPDMIFGHIVLAKARRHLGDNVGAIAEVNRCREVIAAGDLAPAELHLLAPLVDLEERRLSGENLEPDEQRSNADSEP